MPDKRPLIAATCLTVALTACTSGTSTPSNSSHATAPNAPLAIGGTFVVDAGQFTSFDPYKDFNAAFYAPLMYDSLVNVDPSGKVVSGLAKSWTATATDASFTLNSGISCEDGSPLTASGVATAINTAKDPKNNFGPPQQLLPTVPFTVTGDDAAGVVTVKMSSPFSFITRSIGILPIVCPKGLSDLKSVDQHTDGTGPYQLTQFASDGPYVLTRRSDYTWGPDGATSRQPGMPQSIKLEDIGGSQTAANLLLTGEVNAANVNASDIGRLQRAGMTEVDVNTVLGITAFNERPNRLTHDPIIRRALVQATDRNKTAKVAVGGGDYTLAGDLKAKGTACYSDIAGHSLPPFDVNAAEQELTQDGWKPGSDGIRAKNGQRLALTAITEPDQYATLPAISEFMAQQWKTIGVDVTVRQVSGNALVNALYQTGNWDIFVNATPNEPLPSQLIPFQSGPLPPKGVNFAGINNQDYNALTKRALQVAGDASCPLWQQAAAALFQHADGLVIANGSTPFFGNKASFALGNNFNILPTTIRMYK
jgi:peptide/nickel transport system substrate-binding protein